MGQQRACHVPPVLTVLLVPTRRASLLKLLVRLEPLPLVQQRVKHVPPVRAVLRVQLAVVGPLRNARVASAATVVVVGVKLPRPPRVERGRRRWV